MYKRKLHGWRKHFDFVLLDVLMLFLAFVLSAVTRHGTEAFTLADRYAGVCAFYCIVDVLLHVVNQTFSGVLKRGYYMELTRTVPHVVMTEMIIIGYLFVVKQSEYFSRTVILLLPIYYLVLSYVTRIIWKRILRRIGHKVSRAALYVITTKDLAVDTVRRLNREAKGEYQIQGMCILDQDCIDSEIEAVQVTAKMDTLLDFLHDKWVDEIYLALPEGHAIPHSLIDKLTGMGIVVHMEIDPVGTESWQIRQVQYIGGQAVQTISMTNVSLRGMFMKRMLDIVGGIVGCLITVLLTVIFGPLIYIHSPGPIFFQQIRVGRNGKTFKMYKFRSMYLDAEERKQELMKQNRIQDGLMFKMDADPRIIGCKILPDGTVKKGIGNFMRDYSLDEFPQFFNVLKGDMSLVGTRPPTVDEWEKYHYHHRVRLSARPGITGLWQVSGRSQITDFEEVVELDKTYIRSWSMGKDLRILLKTIIVVFRKDGAM